MNHSALKNAVLVRLSEMGVFAWNNATGVATPLGQTRIVRYGMRGAPDIMGILPNGRFLGVEIKTGCGRQSAAQIVWSNRCAEVGGLYIVVRDLKDIDALADVTA